MVSVAGLKPVRLHASSPLVVLSRERRPMMLEFLRSDHEPFLSAPRATEGHVTLKFTQHFLLQLMGFVCRATVRRPLSTWDTSRDSRLGTQQRSNSNRHGINMTRQRSAFPLCLKSTSALELFLDKTKKKNIQGKVTAWTWHVPCLTEISGPLSSFQCLVRETVFWSGRGTWNTCCDIYLHGLRHLRGSSPALCLAPDCRRCSQCSSGGWRSRRKAFGSGPGAGRTAPTGFAASPASLCSTVQQSQVLMWVAQVRATHGQTSTLKAM